jgi:amino acid transporter
MSEVQPESAAAPAEGGKLARGRLNTIVIILLVMAIVAPIGGASGPVSLGIALGNGAGMPGVFLIAMLILLCFAAGYAAMSRRVSETGAFYAYITKGLGRPTGGAGAMVAMLAYNAAFCAMCGYVGFFTKMFVLEHAGVDLPWYLYTAVILLVIFVLGRLNIGIGAGVLVVLLCLELCLFVVFDVGVLVKYGFGAFSLTPFTPHTIWTGGWSGFSVAMMFAVFCFGGVEAAAIYSEEARNPERTVGRATYGAVLAVGIFYLLTSWCLVTVAGYADAQQTALADPGGFGFIMIGQVLGSSAAVIMNLLVITSIFASMTGLHQEIARYGLALARDGLLPRALARVHRVSQAPTVASAAALGLAVVVCLVFILVGADPLMTLAASLSGLTTIGTLILWTVASLAFVVYFRRHADLRWITTLILPAVSFVALGVLLYLALSRYSLVTGVPTAWINSLQWLFVPFILLGVGLMLYKKYTKPDAYALIWPDKPDEGASAGPLLATQMGVAE